MTGWQSTQITVGAVFGVPLLGYGVWSEEGLHLLAGLVLTGMAWISLRETA